MQKYIMALDQGTSISKCILFDKNGKIFGKASKELPQIYPQPGWVEQNPREIWSTQLSVMAEVLAATGITPEHIAGIGIANQRETVIMWNRHTGQPVYNAIVWQCRRTAEYIDTLRGSAIYDKMQQSTGLIPDAYFSASKIAWILDHVEGAREQAEAGDILFGTVDTWLIWNLTGGKAHVTDYSNASRTMLYNIHTLQWDEDILRELNIPKSILPEVKPSSCIYGYSDVPVFDGSIPVCGAAGDQQAALFGQCCFSKGEVKTTYGTGSFLLMNTGTELVMSKKGLLTTIAASVDDQVEYALEGSVFVAGAAIQWLRDEMRLIRDAAQSEKYALRVEDTNEVYIVPAFAGMAAPYWNPYVRGTVVGITRGCKKEHFIRAMLESVAYQAYDVIGAMEEEAGIKLSEMKVDGGASANNMMMQFQADIMRANVLRPECIETTALGAAYLAGLAVGYWKDKEEIRANWKLEYEFQSSMEEERRKKLLKGWKRAVRCALAWAEDEE